MDWAAHLEHLQIAFQEFNAEMVISELVLIRLFHNGLWPSMYAQAKQDGRWKNTWEQAIKKVIIVEAKAALNLLSWVREMDACCFWNHQSPPKVDKRTKEKFFNQNFSRSQKLRP